MPKAKTHDIITLASGIALAPPTFYFFQSQGSHVEQIWINCALLVAAHLLSGLMFSPDLDIDSAIDNRWGPLYWIWRPYMWAVPHRSRWLSHGLVIPPLLRLSFFTVLILGILQLVTWVGHLVWVACPDLVSVLWQQFVHVAYVQPAGICVFLIGFITGSAAHSIADWTVSGSKYLLNKLPF